MADDEVYVDGHDANIDTMSMGCPCVGPPQCESITPHIPLLTPTDETIHTLSVTPTPTRQDMIRALKHDLDKVTREAARLTHAIRALEALDSQEARQADKVKLKGGGPLVNMSYPDAARATLQKANRALTVREILDAMAKQGRPVTTSNPYRTLYKVLRDRTDVVNEGGKWQLNPEGK